MSVQARVQLTASASGSGVIARGSSSNYYAARLLPSGSAQIIRVVNGTVKVLASVPMKIQTEPTWYRVQLDVTGSTTVNLTMSVDGALNTIYREINAFVSFPPLVITKNEDTSIHAAQRS